VIDLDDVGAMRALDVDDMLGVVGALPEHCRAAYDAAVTLSLPDADGVDSVIVCGMGGSAVAGDVLKGIFRERLGIPLEVNRGPVLPAYAGPHTLVVVSSYSGDTSETLASYREAVGRGCRILCITSGGELGADAGDGGIPVISVPAGFQPRAALGHLAFSALGGLEAAGLLPPAADDVDEAVAELTALAGRLGPDSASERNPAKSLARRIGDKVPIIWGAEGIGAVAAMRWKTQMNENGKVPAFWSSMSELDHNEVVGWTTPYGHGYSLIALRHDGEPAELATRFEPSYAIARGAGVDTGEVRGAGRSALARLMSLIIAGDFTSTYVGLRRGINPTPVDAIAGLKASLAGS
jgi:glucose/mannose-6-phosphate isomerase